MIPTKAAAVETPASATRQEQRLQDQTRHGAGQGLAGYELNAPDGRHLQAEQRALRPFAYEADGKRHGAAQHAPEQPLWEGDLEGIARSLLPDRHIVLFDLERLPTG
jgi:hypothetical protein